MSSSSCVLRYTTTKVHSGYCEGELCSIESAVGTDYVVGGTYSRMLPDLADEASVLAVKASNEA
jgi:hypothetical protein